MLCVRTVVVGDDVAGDLLLEKKWIILVWCFVGTRGVDGHVLVAWALTMSLNFVIELDIDLVVILWVLTGGG